MRNRIAALLALALLPACGGGGNVVAPPPVTTPPTPAASISATGNGALVLHPSSDTRFGVAMETPIRVIESGGGSADWNFARLGIFLRGAEIERVEVSATTINAAGFGRINANSNQAVRLIYRFNSSDFDRLDLTLGFTDRRDSRVFTTLVPFQTFSDVNVSLTPLSTGEPIISFVRD